MNKVHRKISEVELRANSIFIRPKNSLKYLFKLKKQLKKLTFDLDKRIRRPYFNKLEQVSLTIDTLKEVANLYMNSIEWLSMVNHNIRVIRKRHHKDYK